MKILYNDWPYGVDKDIIHLVVWVKFELEDDPATDDLTPRARKEIDDYVRSTFCSRMPAENVCCVLAPLPMGRVLIDMYICACRLSGSKTGSRSSQCMQLSTSM